MPALVVQACSAIYLLAILLLFALLGHNHYQIVSARVPLDYFEGSMPLITGIIASGANPYTFEFQPAYADLYPPLYNIIVAPFSLVFGNSLQLHRIVSGFFIVATCVLAYRATRHAGGARLNSLAASVMLYAALLFYSTPVASTNSTGMFFFLASVLIPWRGGFSTGSLLLALICGTLAFYGKQYFGVGLAFVCVYVFIAVSKAKAVIFGVAVAGVVGGSLALVHLGSPYFLDNTLFSIGNAVRILRSTEVMINQMLVFAETYAGLLVLLLIALAAALYAHRRDLLSWPRSPGLRAMSTLRNPGAPLLRWKPDFWWSCLVFATLLVVFLLGRNPGNYMTYLFQLMSPFLLIATFSMRSLQGHPGTLLLPLVLYNFYSVYAILPRDFSVPMGNWNRLDAMVRRSEHVLASPIMLMALLDNGKRVYQDGHTFFFRMAKEKPRILEPADENRRVTAVWDDFIGRLYKDVETRHFDLVLLTSWDLNGIFAANPPPHVDAEGVAYFRQFYELRGTLPVSMTKRPGGGTYPMQVWRPRAAP